MKSKIKKKKILALLVDPDQHQTGGTRLARECSRALGEHADVIERMWVKDFNSQVSRKSYFLGNLEICTWLIKEKPHAFYCDSRMFPIIWFAVIVGKMLGVCFVTTLQGSHHRVSEQGWVGFTGKLRFYLLKLVCQRSDVLIANSSVTKMVAIEEYGVKEGRVKVVLPGFEPLSVKNIGICWEEKDIGKLKILCVSRYEWRKGLDVFLKALEMDDNIDYNSIVVGDRIHDEDGVTYWRFLNTLAKGMDVELRGRAEKKRLAELYGWADVVVVPSRYEAFGIVVLEALCNGVIVLASDSLPEEILSVSNRIFRFKNEDSGDLSLKLAEIAKSKLAKEGKSQFPLDNNKWDWRRFRFEFAQAALFSKKE